MAPMATDIELLAKDKYNGDASQITEEDQVRLASGEPLAYVIGWMPFRGLSMNLESKPLIPRTETEWWTELCSTHLKKRFGTTPFSILDLCAGSGAIGLSLARDFPNAAVTLSELVTEHCDQIKRNRDSNNLASPRITVIESDLFAALADSKFNIIVSNPPYIPTTRELDASVKDFEPAEALFAGTDGLEIIRRIASEAPAHVLPGGELWMEVDSEHITEAEQLIRNGGALRTEILKDQYDRPRLVVAYY